MINNKTMRNLGLIKNICGSFRDSLFFKFIFCALVHSNFKYCPLIWTNSTSKQNDIIESVLKNFLRFICLKLNIYKSPQGLFELVFKCIILSSLGERRTYYYLIYYVIYFVRILDIKSYLSLIRFKIKYVLNIKKE